LFRSGSSCERSQAWRPAADYVERQLRRFVRKTPQEAELGRPGSQRGKSPVSLPASARRLARPFLSLLLRGKGVPTVSQKREDSLGFCLAGNRAGRAQLLEEFFAQTVEAAVRHNQQQVARLGFARKKIQNGR